MKTSWVIDGGSLRITVKDGPREQSWALRSSQKTEILANSFAEIAEALGMKAIVPPLQETLQNSTPVGWIGAASGGKLVPLESPERAELRRQAQATLAGANAAKAIRDGEEQTVAGLPEVIARESEDQQTDIHGFETLPPASAAVDGSIYKPEDYRADKSNWVK